MAKHPIRVETFVNAPIEEVWHAYTTPEHITRWNFASADWCCPRAEVDLRPGGRQSARMEAKDGSMGFDFGGTYEEVMPPEALTLILDDGRKSRTTFEAKTGGTLVTTLFDPEDEHPEDLQRDGWQAILDSFKSHVECTSRDGAPGTSKR
ncbi:MAG: activator of HSP90 ATPase [Rhodobacteraceae bacterium]|nr:activator of HSP90 ATPase [Paracoccaceae bacterium]